jgi:hypothetical protein
VYWLWPFVLYLHLKFEAPNPPKIKLRERDMYVVPNVPTYT